MIIIRTTTQEIVCIPITELELISKKESILVVHTKKASYILSSEHTLDEVLSQYTKAITAHRENRARSDMINTLTLVKAHED